MFKLLSFSSSAINLNILFCCIFYYVLTKHILLNTFIQEALHACDIGLIMGRNIDGFALSKFAHHLHSSLSELSTPISLKVSHQLMRTIKCHS